MDIFTEQYIAYQAAVKGMSLVLFLTLLRAAVILWVCALLSGAVFHLALNRLPRAALAAATWAASLAGLFLAVEIPLDRFTPTDTARGWIVAFTGFSVITLPWALTFFLVGTAGWRKLLAMTIYGLLAVVFVIAFSRTGV